MYTIVKKVVDFVKYSMLLLIVNLINFFNKIPLSSLQRNTCSCRGNHMIKSIAQL
ncbi:hypothetical protein [Alphabaculovirus altersperidaniae]|uniref:Uncharacterized protein n=1 Tax=Spodoptera eridania nucleopolyhedrovirus TaxID=2315721 RepID=A0ABX6TSC8_9ABAC|nr:hypothetical protein QKS47_gp092 [Spodoptera eridania nucleopolyhedrovirus]QNV47887.1 hypothetical protein [Spodoptera eridania nucleopolyhedrovirus]